MNYMAIHVFYWRCSWSSGLFVSVHVRRWAVLQLYTEHVGYINDWATLRLHKR